MLIEKVKGFEELKTVNLHSIHVNKLHTIARSLSVAPFAGLDGLFQFLEVVAVYVSHEKKTYGEQQQGTNYLAANGFSVSGVKNPTASNSVQYNLVILSLAQHWEICTLGQPVGGNLKRANAEAALSARRLF
uniref:Uncharacterized protein n=1 Tax=Solanum lycopersicum TaxID=4081 RepID=A0A3Q7FRI7_SOLLC